MSDINSAFTLENFIRTAQYYATIAMNSDYMQETVTVLERFFHSDLVCIVKDAYAPQIVARNTACEGTVLSQQCSVFVKDVFESGFLRVETINAAQDKTMQTAFLPVSVFNKVEALLCAGYLTEATFSKASLNILLAISSLLGSFLEKQSTQHSFETLLKEHQTILLAAGEGIMGIDEKGFHTFVNPAAASLLGYTPEEMIGKDSHALWHQRLSDGTHLDKSACLIHNVYTEGKAYTSSDECFVRKDGTTFDAEATVTPVVENGRIEGAVIVFKDISERKRMLEELRESEQNYADLYNNAPDMYLSVDSKSADVINCNLTVCNKLGYTKEEIIGHPVFALYHPDSLPKVKAAFAQFLKTGQVTDAELKARRKDGSSLEILLNSTAVRNEEGEILYSRSTWTDISEIKTFERHLAQQNRDLQSAKQSLQYQAEHDTLTGLPNRLLFLDRLNQALKYAGRNKNRLAVLFMDLDHFKEINDSLGHDLGDELLIMVAEKLEDLVRKSDTVSRLGGDEFTMIIDGVNKSDYIVDITQKILQTMSQPFKLKNYEIVTSFSIGIAVYPEDGTRAETLLKNADVAMYKAKAEGRNNYQFYTADMTERAFERIMLESQLRNAIDRHELQVYYQAQIDTQTERIIGMEALVRWHHPQLGVIPPSKFIPLAEDTGMIIVIDAQVMRDSFAQWKLWMSRGLDPGILSINITREDIYSKNFIQNIASLLEENRMDPSRIMFELTESMVMKNPEEAKEILNALSSLGVGLAIDDFGTGYSSLSYLKQLPFNKLKIDKSFIDDIPNDRTDMQITCRIIAMARGLNLGVIAEGVENAQQQAFLTANGCNEIQGFLYHEPAPKDEAETFLKRLC